MDTMIHREERGQNIVLLALTLPVLVGMLALGIDGGYGYAQRLRMQTAADAAALAGARALALEMTNPQVGSTIAQYATGNGAATFTWSVVGANAGVQVNTQVTWNTFFAGIVGLPTMTAVADATASIEFLSATGNLLPIAVYEFPFVPSTTYSLWDDEMHAPGSFGWLDWDGGGGGAAQLADDILNPSNSGSWSIGDLVPPKTGVVSSSLVRNALDTWINQHVTVPIYDQVTGNGSNTRYSVSGFAEFVLTGHELTGANKHVDGYFIQWVEAGQSGGSQGVRTIRLTQ